MTRINAGVPVEDLCDQHLVAEYRELPRMVKFVAKQPVLPDLSFTLNAGHMKSCALYGAYLAERHAALIAEMQHRGFTPNLPALHPNAFRAAAQRYPSHAWLEAAAATLRPRILARLQTMAREPTWTRRVRPEWTLGVR